MPGVHVRTLSQLDWFNQEKESLLTIPGSYWLCHKKNIYKFIFRYHRTVKNTTHFSYGRELLKVIRRIIKCHPCQGQQFGTQHLLVTYNCTSWTRQDKMFAILKFQQKCNAAAFSHAFVLTIKICSSSEHSEKNMKQHSINHTQECVQELSLKTTKRTSEIEIKEANVIDQESESITIQKQNQQMQNIQKYKTYSSLKLPTEIKNGIDELLLPNKFSLEKNLIEKDSPCTVNNKNSLDGNKETISETTADASNVPYQYFIEKEIEDAKQSMKLDTFLVIDQPMQKDVETEIKNINEDSTTNIIKNVIKKKNSKSVHTQQKEHYNETPDLKSQRNDKQHIRTSIYTDNSQSQNNAYIKSYKPRKQKNRESEKKTIPDDKILRSSNITDLVMEGLMFTIRQDQDSIAVIEQKTKLEVDEVLENSEKVETKAGEKCLLNSSLLRLENLVKMIDLPPHKNEHHKADHAISNSTYSLPFDIFPNSSIHNSDINSIQRRIDSVPIYNIHNMDHLNPSGSEWKHQCISSNIKKITTKKSEQLMEWQSSDNEQSRKDRNDIEIEKKEKEEDITPEISQSTIFSFEKTNARLENRDLLNDINIDINMKGIDKCNTSMEGHYSSLLPSILSNPTKILMKKNSTILKEASSTKLPQQETNFPRIVSDKVITVEQMPLALQNVVRHTYKTRRFSSKTSNEMIQHKQKIQRHNTMLTIDTISETDMNNSIKSAIDTEEMKNKAESDITINKDVSKINGNTYERNIKEKNYETHCTSQRSSSFKHSSPRKLQDITDDFYYDLSHMHNRDNAQQRCFRQGRNLNNPDDIKNSNVHIEMLKFIQDITEGARVVVRRLNMEKKRDSKSNLLEKDSALVMYTH